MGPIQTVAGVALSPLLRGVRRGCCRSGCGYVSASHMWQWWHFRHSRNELHTGGCRDGFGYAPASQMWQGWFVGPHEGCAQGWLRGRVSLHTAGRIALSTPLWWLQIWLRARVSLQSVAGETLLALLIVVRMGGMGTRLLPSRGRGGWQP
jgi:hypothetical protein